MFPMGAAFELQSSSDSKDLTQRFSQTYVFTVYSCPTHGFSTEEISQKKMTLSLASTTNIRNVRDSA